MVPTKNYKIKWELLESLKVYQLENVIFENVNSTSMSVVRMSGDSLENALLNVVPCLYTIQLTRNKTGNKNFFLIAINELSKLHVTNSRIILFACALNRTPAVPSFVNTDRRLLCRPIKLWGHLVISA